MEIFFKRNLNKKKTFFRSWFFHGVTARNVCELLHFQIHKDDFKYIGLDLFEENEENKNEIIPIHFFYLITL